MGGSDDGFVHFLLICSVCFDLLRLKSEIESEFQKDTSQISHSPPLNINDYVCEFISINGERNGVEYENKMWSVFR
jgi:hypothetical protein